MKNENTIILIEEIRHHIKSIEKEINKGDNIYYPYLFEQMAFLQKYITILKKQERVFD